MRAYGSIVELLYYGETMPSDEPATGHSTQDDSLRVPIGTPQAGGTIADADRYSRQVLFPGIGLDGQQRLFEGHAAIVGCGATGAAVAALLARAGVGTLTLIDRDFVEPSNLQRQMLYDEADALASLPKAEAARRHIGLFNSGVTVRSHVADLTPTNIAELLDGAQIILDATDNFETRYLLNDFSVQQGVPWIYSAAIGGYAATMNILPAAKRGGGTDGGSGEADPPSACLACIFPKPPGGTVETCDTAGILSMAVNIAASLQAAEALKFLTGQRRLMRQTLLSLDVWAPAQGGGLERSEISTATPRVDCTVCGKRIFSHLAGEGRAHITLCGRDSVQIHEHHRPVDFAAMRLRLADHADIRELKANDLLLRFRRGPYTLTVFGDGRAIVQGTTDVSVARSLYARFVGA